MASISGFSVRIFIVDESNSKLDITPFMVSRNDLIASTCSPSRNAVTRIAVDEDSVFSPRVMAEENVKLS